MADKIIDRIKKLLALAQSSNVNEAANAAAAAAKLMQAHQIEAAVLAATPEAQQAIEEPITSDVLQAMGTSKLARWAGMLAYSVCQANGCKSWRMGGTLHIIGRPSDAQTARYLFAYLTREIDRLTSEASDERGQPGKTWCNNFRLGAVEVIGRRLRESAEAARREARQQAVASDTLGTGAALVRVDHALARIEQHRDAIEAYGKKLGLRAAPRVRVTYDASAREAGRRAGASVQLGGSGRPLSSGARGALRG